MAKKDFCYLASEIKDELFGRKVKNAKKARKVDPMDDPEMSELVWDVVELIHSAEWYRTGDISLGEYYSDMEAFKNKWFNHYEENKVRRIIDGELELTRERIIQQLSGE